MPAKPIAPTKSKLDGLEAVSKILLIVGTLIGGAWAVLEYFQARAVDRVHRTLGYVERFNKDEMILARTHLGGTWFALKEYVKQMDAGSSTQQEFNQRKTQLVMQVIESAPVRLEDGSTRRGLVGDLDIIQGFFGELQICITGKLCDSDTARSYFADYASHFHCLHKPFIEYKRRDYDSTYGVGLEEFVRGTGNNCDSPRAASVPAQGHR